MAQFSESDIDAAKRRVQEMRNRATRFTDDFETENTDLKENDIPVGENKENTVNNEDKDKSFAIILALIMLLSKEGADNKLILALLYLLL